MANRRKNKSKRRNNKRLPPPSDDPPPYHCRGYPFDLRFTTEFINSNKETTYQVKHLYPLFKAELSLEPHTFTIHRVSAWSMHTDASIGIRTYSLQPGNSIHRMVVDHPGRSTFAHVSAPLGSSKVELSTSTPDIWLFSLGTDTDNVNLYMRVQGLWHLQPQTINGILAKTRLPIYRPPVSIGDVFKALDNRYTLKKDAKALPTLS